MARKVTNNAVNAFLTKNNGVFNNTTVTTENGITKMFLFDNMIAKLENGVLYITNAGWFTNTTKERLNGFDNVFIYQKNKKWYLNGVEWDGKLTKI